ncbi:MAG TPA: hypothetical protein VM537_33595 [Anaerolineae bacterium]|nr:hypothetical protein [Anaerolineae bacterium]
MRRILRDLLERWLYDRRYHVLDVGIAGLIGLALGVAWMILVALKGR